MRVRVARSAVAGGEARVEERVRRLADLAPERERCGVV